MNNRKLEILKIDTWLRQAEDDIYKRKSLFDKRLHDIISINGSLSDFANGHLYFGIHYLQEEKSFVYREWAPKAYQLYLTGDFNNWNKTSHPLVKIDNGIWEIKLPESQYLQTFVHGSKIKTIVESQLGTHHRIPAYIKRVIQDEDTKNFSGQVWLPEPFDWQDDKFEIKNTKELYIYEAHVGMAQDKKGVGTYSEFTEKILPYIKSAGYNAIQLMAIQEHPYYGSFGYHVSNFFAPSSRFGTPEDLKELIKTAHQLGIAVILDLVHSHSVKNFAEGLNQFDGSDNQYFYRGEQGIHSQWDSMIFDYGKSEVQHFLLSNIKYWIDDFHFDGFRFDGVGSLMYWDHGLGKFEKAKDYFSGNTNKDAILYLQLATTLADEVKDGCVCIAEDVTGMPGLTVDVFDGGIGFDYRLGMGIPDFWIRYLQDITDEQWNMQEIWNVLNDRLSYVKTVAYCESHDQALVGDKTISYRLMDKEMLFKMGVYEESLVIDRGMALHKMIRMITLVIGGQAYMNFMGNEFGHPEWIDFPRKGNNWSYDFARRQWSLLENPFLRFKLLANFDKAMINLSKRVSLLSAGYGNIIRIDNENKCIIFEKANLIFAFNFHHQYSIPGYEIPIKYENTYKICLNSDSVEFGGQKRIDEAQKYKPLKTDKNKFILKIYLPSRTMIVLEKE